MKKLTTSVLVVVLTSSFALVNAQKKDTARVQDIEGVVVTALGIKREKKSLTYSTQEIKGDDLSSGTTNTGNIASQLSGKVAGLQVNTNNNFGGSSNLVIRGYKSLKGGGPLIVIDGSPVNNNIVGNNGAGYVPTFDYGNALSDINQADIESVNVLKGAAASALYGERGLNGVILITTKTGKGKSDKEWGVTLSSSTNMGFIDKTTFPTYQTMYGGGYAPQFTFGSDYTNYNDDASLGPKYDGHPVFFWDSFDPNSVNFGKKMPYQAAGSTPVDFFDKSTNYTNTISLQKAGEKSNFLLNYSNQMQTGILPNTDLNKNTISTKFNFDFTDKLSADLYSSLTLQNTTGRNETGYSDNIMSMFRQWWNVDSDMNALRSAYQNSGQNISWNRNAPDDATPAYWNNPYFQRFESFNSDRRTRTFSTASLNYKFSKNISATAKLSYDDLALLVEQRVAEGSVPQNFGASNQAVSSGYSKYNIHQSETNFDLFVNYKFDITDKLDISGLVGGNIRRNRNETDYASTEGGLIVPGLYAIGNSLKPILATAENLSTTLTSGVFGTASLGYNDTFFVDGTYRVDKSSTLPSDTNSYGYGSVAGSIVLSNLVKQDWLSFWKIRGNYAVVGGTAGAYQLKNTYSSLGIFNGTNTGLFDTSNTRAKADLKPERSKEVELGMEMQFFKRRLGFDVTVYNSKTTNQIINLPVSVATGYSATVFNAGRIDNKGIEVSLNATPLKSQDFSWDISANWAKNRNEVIELENGVDNYLLTNGYQGGVQLVAAVGQAFGALYGTDYVYVGGQRVVTSPNAAGLGGGLWAKSDKKVIGNVTPDWTGGVRNTFAYKGISMSFLIDVQQGGDTFSTDLLYGQSGGLYSTTTDAQYRDPKNVVLPGVYANGSPNVTPLGGINSAGNRVRNVNNYYSYQPNGYNNAPNSEFVYDTSYVKLREASIAYSLPKNILAGTYVKEVTLSLVGRNLWIIHKNTPFVDPEAGVGGGLRSRGNSIGILPTTRDIGFNVTLKF